LVVVASDFLKCGCSHWVVDLYSVRCLGTLFVRRSPDMKERGVVQALLILGMVLTACSSLPIPIPDPTVEPTPIPTSDYRPGDIAVTLPPEWTPTATIQPTISGTPTISPTASPTAYPTWQPCEDAPSSQLLVGSEAEAASDQASPKEVWNQPGRESALVVGVMNPGEDIEILGGPVCMDQMVWWEIESLERDLEGWMPEGDGDSYWIVPSQ
jgi:hypothetical protein